MLHPENRRAFGRRWNKGLAHHLSNTTAPMRMRSRRAKNKSRYSSSKKGHASRAGNQNVLEEPGYVHEDDWHLRGPREWAKYMVTRGEWGTTRPMNFSMLTMNRTNDTLNQIPRLQEQPPWEDASCPFRLWSESDLASQNSYVDAHGNVVESVYKRCVQWPLESPQLNAGLSTARCSFQRDPPAVIHKADVALTDYFRRTWRKERACGH
ncbi:unnamed protein product [Amoebophrya sp. A25]|nr:unnamed protein product [Amoebophrya sp. A25]|eukprot:GSA25T00003681001.1